MSNARIVLRRKTLIFLLTSLLWLTITRNSRFLRFWEANLSIWLFDHKRQQHLVLTDAWKLRETKNYYPALWKSFHSHRENKKLKYSHIFSVHSKEPTTFFFVMALLWVTNRTNWKISLTTVVNEPATFGLLAQCSVNWAIRSRQCEYVILRNSI